jgi:hypothetical protein
MPNCIVICAVAPGPFGRLIMGLQAVRQLNGPNGGIQLGRKECESAQTFEARCDAMVEGKQCP